ncbi:MAG: hypothetical protein WBD25_22145 [Terriglobales bacterium]|jgi:hypothetical protein
MARSRFSACFVLFCAANFFVTISASAAQPQAALTQKDLAPEKPSHAQSADVSGDWQVSWQGRLGAEECLLHLQQDGTKLTGTLKSLHGLSSLSGTVDSETVNDAGKRISFDVKFEGPHPFTTRFTGTANDGKIEGTSQAISVGGSGAYLGHAGEIAQPEHPWTAVRVVNQFAKTGSDPNPPAKK